MTASVARRPLLLLIDGQRGDDAEVSARIPWVSQVITQKGSECARIFGGREFLIATPRSRRPFPSYPAGESMA